MNVVSREKSTVVSYASDLEVGGVYQVKGTTLRPDKDRFGNFVRVRGEVTFTRKPIPPQLVVIIRPPTLTYVAVHYYCDDGVRSIERDGILSLSDVNIPETGDDDRHLERIPDATIMSGMKKLSQMNREQNYMEMSMDRQTWAKDHWE